MIGKSYPKLGYPFIDMPQRGGEGVSITIVLRDIIGLRLVDFRRMGARIASRLVLIV